MDRVEQADCGRWNSFYTYQLLMCNCCSESRRRGMWFACSPPCCLCCSWLAE